MTAPLPYLDPERDIDARLKDLLGRMTLEEKLAQLGCVQASDLLRPGTGGPGADGPADAGLLDEAAAGSLLANGIGCVSGIAAAGPGPGECAALVDALQRHLLTQTRLGIPALVVEGGATGLGAAGTTRFPAPIGLAATWHPRQVQAMAEIVRHELLALGVRQTLAPVLDVARDPRWGLLEETCGEDPYLTGRFATAWVRGLQGQSLTEGVVATGRHFPGSGLPEGGMHQAPVHLGPRELREVCVEPFAAAIREAGLRSVMVSQSVVDGLAPAGSPEILEDLLRGELAFGGIVLANEESVGMLVKHHRVARDKAAAALQALEAGVDVEWPATDCYGEPLATALSGAKPDLSRVDRAVRRVLKLKFELGLLDEPPMPEASAMSALRTTEARELARVLAEQSMVLLKNDGLLPLAPGTRLAVVGPAADDARLLLSGTQAEAEDAEARQGARPEGEGPGLVTPRQAVEAHCPVIFRPGCALTGSDADGIDDAAAAARDAEVAVVCVGGRSGRSADCTSGEFRDATDLGLTGLQRRLVEAVADTGTPVVLVVIGGRAFALEREVGLAGAALLAWLPGEAGGTALARVLLGQVNPAGRLPVSLARSAGQLPVHYNHRAGGGRSALMGDYLDQSARPLYPFGHGLSYTSFEYEELSCPDTADVHATLNLWVTVRNTGTQDGEEVVQVYVRDKLADVARPVRQLVGFKRVAVPAGECRRLKLLLDVSQLAYHDRQMRFVVDPGEVEVMVGASSRDIRLRKTVMLQGERRPLQQQQVLATQVEVVDPGDRV